MVQIVNNDTNNNSVKFEKDSPLCFWVLEWQGVAPSAIEINGILSITQHWDTAISLNCFNYWHSNFQITILNEINFFLIIIYTLLKFKTVYLFSWKFLWTTNIQNALLLVNGPL